MNKDQLKGRLDQAKGKAKEITGTVIGSSRLQTEGRLEQIAGKSRTVLGNAKGVIEDKVKHLTKRG